MLVYSLLRLGLLAVALVALWAVGLGGWLLVVVAAVVAWALSYVLLGGPRDRAALWVAERAQARRSGPRFTPGVESDAAAEDAEAAAPAPDDRPAQSERPSPSSTP
ncbi:DUF4229 domain-containing protein [Actinotalea solisilvae]|uniref:DUF4229 domain-containing protein n=1 Tax=Actinotalea solisilvae TaxID=2072922 RepID=UPI001F170053|nr:DUF4229 domain-containing protein [Actinotalea solisilvae]